MIVRLVCIATAALAPCSAGLAAPTDLPERLTLVCAGTASFKAEETTVATIYGDDGPATGRARSVRETTAPDQLTLRIVKDDVRIRPPLALDARGRRGGEAWWSVNAFDVYPDQLSGSFTLGRFTVDRRTGEVDFSGPSGSFRGQCEPQSSEAEQRRF